MRRPAEAAKSSNRLIAISFSGDFTTRWIESGSRPVDGLEIAAFGFFGRPSPYLSYLATRIPLVVRADSLSIGTPGPLDTDRVDSLVDVCRATQCRYVVHPLGFSAAAGIDLGLSVPLRRTGETIATVAEHLGDIEKRTGRPSLLEPIASPLRVAGPVAESDFLGAICRQARCRLLIDVASVLVECRTHGTDPQEWIGGIDPRCIGAVRVGGCVERDGRWRRDQRAVPDEDAWSLAHLVMTRASLDVAILRAYLDESSAATVTAQLRRLRDAH